MFWFALFPVIYDSQKIFEDGSLYYSSCEIPRWGLVRLLSITCSTIVAYMADNISGYFFS